jgi:uncharacterized protein (DUF302 family)
MRPARPAKGTAMKTIGRYAIEVTTRRTFEDAIARATELLAEQGFGVLTEIDVQATMKKKLDVDVRPYRILGACNAPFAHRALAAVPHAGVLLPCNVVVWDEGDHRVVTAMEPRLMAEIVDHPEMKAVADEVSARLHAVLDAIG